jgi:hypothetical protein
MTATTVARVKVSRLEGKQTVRKRVWRCNFCATGNHGSCPGAIWHQRRVENPLNPDEYKIVPHLWTCECKEPGHPHFPYCTTCRNDTDDEVNPNTWTCWDPHACATKLEARRRHSRVYQMVLRAKVHATAKRRAKRLMDEKTVELVEPGADATMDRLHEFLAQLDAIEEERLMRQRDRKSKKPRRPKPKVVKCECCGEPTRGGRFIPGHDAKLASALRLRVKDGDAEAYEEMKRRNWLKKLPASLLRAEDK